MKLSVQDLNSHYGPAHILFDGRIEPHAATEKRLLRLAGGEEDDLFGDPGARLAEAYRRRAHAVAARLKRPH